MERTNQQLSQKEQSLAKDAARYTVSMSVGNGDRKQGAVGRCLTNQTKYYERRLSNDDSKEVRNKHLSLADELDRLTDDNFAPIDQTLAPANKSLETKIACERDEVTEMEIIDLASPEIRKASTAAKAGIASALHKPKTPSKLAYQLEPTAHSTEKPDPNPISSTQPSRSQIHPSPSLFPDPTNFSNTKDEAIEKNQRTRSPIEIWLDGIGDAGVPEREGVHGDGLESDIAEHERDILPIIPIIDDENSKSASASRDETQDASLTRVQQDSSRQNSYSTKVANDKDASGQKPKPGFNDNDEWSSDVDFDADVRIQTRTSWPYPHTHDRDGDGDGDGDGDIGDSRVPVALPKTPSPPIPHTQTPSPIHKKALNDFIKVSICAIDAIRANRDGDRYAGDKVREVQELVERVLVGEVCGGGRRVGVGDRFVEGVWRVVER